VRTVTELLPTRADFKAERLRRLDAKCREHLLPFVARTTPSYIAGWVHEELCAHLEWFYAEIAAKRAPRLIICQPPQTGKSKIISGRAPVWANGRYPGLNVGVGTYGQALANRHSRDARECARNDVTFRVFPDIRPKRRERNWYADYRRNDVDTIVEWQFGGTTTAEGLEVRGTYKAVGVGGPLTGFPLDALIVDDPLKDAAEADGAEQREKVWEWFGTTARTRLAAGGGICVTMTRWHDDDLVGRLLKAMEAGGESWRIVMFPAIAEVDEYSQIDGRLLRHAGESVHEARKPLREYLALKGDGDVPGTMNEFQWAALFQQRPIPLSGGIVKPEDFSDRYEVLPVELERRILSYDTATSEDPTADWTVCIESAEKGAKCYIVDVYRKRVDIPELLSHARSKASAVNPNVVLIEDKSSGRQLWQLLEDPNWCPEWHWPNEKVKPEQIGSKRLRLMLETPALRAKQIILPKWAPWLPDFLAEVLGAPRYATWDQADALSRLLRYRRENPQTGGFAEAMGQW
jgi:predicted phage terminase large subunit-like protein